MMLTAKNLDEPGVCPFCKIDNLYNDLIQIAVTDIGEYTITAYACGSCGGEWDEFRINGEFVVWVPIVQ